MLEPDSYLNLIVIWPFKLVVLNLTNFCKYTLILLLNCLFYKGRKNGVYYNWNASNHKL